jgi:hyaluronan synthase
MIDVMKVRARLLSPAERSRAESDRAWEIASAAAIVCGLVFLTLTYAYDAGDLLARAAGRPLLGPLARLTAAWTAFGAVLLALRTGGWFSYAAAPSASEEDAPTLTVVIPAYNEGAMVRNAIDSAARAAYPAGRRRVVVVDDGSTDDTWEHVLAAAADHPDAVIPLRLTRNQGKRAALAAGFRRTDAEVLVVVDSDSVIEPDALLAVAGPFRDPKVGAVAGKVTVYNVAQGLIPRLLYVDFLFIADFMRSWESLYRTVHCCPGALMAVRASAAKKVLGAWLDQRFLGARCTIGDDRALTNYLLLDGHDTVYQRTAVVRTVVPATYAKLCRMLLRWNRSYVREELRFLGRVLWRRPPKPRFLSLFDRLVTNAGIPVYYASLLLFYRLGDGSWSMPLYFLLYVSWISAFYLLYYMRQQRAGSALYAFFYPFYAAFALSWIFPYALATARNRSWMTR